MSRRWRSTRTAAKPLLPPARRAGCGSRPRAAASGARTTRSPPRRRGSRRRPTCRPTPSARSSSTRTTRPGTRFTPARASRTAPVTPRPDSASSSRPTAACSWPLVAGSQSVAINRSIGAIAGQARRAGARSTSAPTSPATARRRSNGGRRTPPNAPALGVYKSTDGGATFSLATDLATKTPPNPAPAASGVDWFQGGITKLELDPNNANDRLRGGRRLRALALERRRQLVVAGLPDDEPGRHVRRPRRVRRRRPRRRQDPHLPRRLLGRPRRRARVWRTDDAASIAGSPNGRYGNAGWTRALELDQRHQRVPRLRLLPERPVRLRRLRRQPGRPAGVGSRHANELWLGGSMNYDELVGVRRTAAALQRPGGDPLDQRRRSGGQRRLAGHDRRRSAPRRRIGSRAASTRTSTRSCSTRRTRVSRSSARTAEWCASTCAIHGTRSAACSSRTFVYNNGHGTEPLAPADLADCQRALSGDPDRDHAAERRAEHDPVPVAVVQPGQPDGRSCSAARRTTAPSRTRARAPGSSR